MSPKNPSDDEKREADKKAFELEKKYGSWPQFETYEDFTRAKQAGRLSVSKSSLEAEERANELTPKRIEEIFCALAGVELPLTEKIKKTHWVWEGGASPGGVPYFGQAQYDPHYQTTNCRRWAYDHFIGFTGDELGIGTRVFQNQSCPRGCTNPWHMVKGSKSKARQQ